MQLVLTVVVILGAAFVALVCDFLKGNNQLLRELAVELKVRREEERNRLKLTPHALATALAGVMAPATVPTAAVGNERSARARTQEASTDSGSVVEASSLDANHLDANQIEEPVSAGRPVAVTKRPDRQRRAVAPNVLAAIRRGEQLATSPKPRRSLDSAPSERPAIEELPVEHHEPMVRIPVVKEMQAGVTQAAAAPAPTPVSGASRDWVSLLNSRREPSATNLVKPNNVAVATSSTAPRIEASPEPALPAGFQDGFVLTRLLESHRPISGLVVSIGAGASQGKSRCPPVDVPALIRSLIGPNDFAAQSGKDEFLLIYPNERGASAQRRLSQIAEQLWDFQLRSLGSLSILFSWGGVEVRGESIDEAIASATRSRVLPMEAAADVPLRRAV